MTAPFIEVVVPSTPAGVRLCRLLVAGLGDEAGLDIEQIDDLRIAIDELSYLVVEHPEPPDAPLRLRAEVSGDEISVRGVVDVPGGWEPPVVEDASIQARLLAGVADSYSITPGDADFGFGFSKRLA